MFCLFFFNLRNLVLCAIAKLDDIIHLILTLVLQLVPMIMRHKLRAAEAFQLLFHSLLPRMFLRRVGGGSFLCLALRFHHLLCGGKVL